MQIRSLTRMKSTFEGRCVKTMVLMRPSLLATQPLRREEMPAMMLLMPRRLPR